MVQNDIKIIYKLFLKKFVMSPIINEYLILYTN